MARPFEGRAVHAHQSVFPDFNRIAVVAQHGFVRKTSHAQGFFHLDFSKGRSRSIFWYTGIVDRAADDFEPTVVMPPSLPAFALWADAAPGRFWLKGFFAFLTKCYFHQVF